MDKRKITIGPVIRGVTLLIGLIAVFFIAWACVDSQMFHAAVGTLVLFIILTPFLSLKEYDLFCPWSFVIITVVILTTPQAICTSFYFPTPDSIDLMMELGKGPEFFFFPGAVLVTAFICLTVGYYGFRSKRPRDILIGRVIEQRSLFVVLVVFSAIALVSTAAFIRVTGGVSADRITDKRTNLKTLDVEAGDTRQHGHLRQISKLSSAVFIIFYSFALTRIPKFNLLVGFLLVIGLMTSIALPFYSSSRAQVLWVIINTIGVNYYLGHGHFFKKLALFVVIGLSFFTFMSAVRNRDHSEGMETASLTRTFESLVLNRNGAGLSKTAHIINAIPEKLEYQNGATIAEWLLAPIPRAIYHTKPMMGTGTEIGTAIYGTKLSGIPPGIVAELYWNFHLPGVVLGMLLFGYFLEKVYAFFRDIKSDPAIIVPVYLFSVVPIAFGILGNSIGYGTMMRLVDFISICMVIWFCTKACVPHAASQPQPNTTTPAMHPISSMASRPTAKI